MPERWAWPYAGPIGRPESADRFVIRIPDPAGPSEVLREIQALAGPGEIGESDVAVRAIEVAVDAYPNGGANPDRLVYAAAHLVKHHAHPPSGTDVITSPGRFSAVAGISNVERALRDGFTVNSGLMKAEHRARYYVKTTDGQPDGPYRQLPRDQHRARIEVTLSGSKCPIDCLGAWRTFRFEALSEYFAQVIPTENPTQMTEFRNAWGARLGRPRDTVKQAAHRRQAAPATRRDTALNARIKEALRALTGRTRTAEIRGKRNLA